MSAHAIHQPDLLLPRVSTRDVSLWGAAALFVLAAHLGTAWVIHEWRPDDSMSSEAASAVEIELAPMAIAPEAIPDEMPELVESAAAPPAEEILETVEPEETATAERVVESTVDEVEPVKEPEITPTPMEAVETDAVDEVVETAELEPVTETVEPVTETVETPTETVKPIEEVPPDLVEAPLPEVAFEVPSARPVEEVTEPVVKKAAARKPAPAKKKPAPTAKPPSQLKAQDAPATAAPKPAQASAGSGMSPARWQSRVNAHLNRHKRFPSGAKGQGVVAVRFAISPSGQVLSASVARSSGDAVLDSAAVDLVRRASPVPAPPPSIAQVRLGITVPISFRR